MTLRVHPDEIVEQSSSPLLAIAPWWERVPVGEVASVTNGAAFKSKQFNNEGRGLPLIRIRDVGQPSTNTFYDGEYEDRHLVSHGDLLIGMDGDFRVARWDGPTALLNQRVCRLGGVNGQHFNERFLEYCIQPYLDAVHEVTSAVTVKHLSSRTVAQLPIPLPPLAEQERIVAAIEEHFSHLDAAEASLHRAQRNLNRLRTSMVLQTLDGDWPVATLQDHTEEQRYGTSAKASTSGDVPVLRMGNIIDGQLDYSNLKFLPSCHGDLETCVLQEGDLLFNRTNSPELVGKSAVFRDIGRDVTFASYLIRVRTQPSLNPEWASTYINSPAGRRYIDSVRTQQVGQSNVNGTKLKQLPLPVPPRELQDQLLDELSDWADHRARLASSLETQRRRCTLLRRAVLAAAFSGRLVPQNPTDKPASVLLDRIRAEAPAKKKSTRKKKSA